MEFTPREARLKPEFAELYPPLVPGIWETAAEMGAKVLLWQVQQQGTDALSIADPGRAALRVPGRLVPGGETDLRTRASDPAFNGPSRAEGRRGRRGGAGPAPSSRARRGTYSPGVRYPWSGSLGRLAPSR